MFWELPWFLDYICSAEWREGVLDSFESLSISPWIVSFVLDFYLFFFRREGLSLFRWMFYVHMCWQENQGSLKYGGKYECKSVLADACHSVRPIHACSCSSCVARVPRAFWCCPYPGIVWATKSLLWLSFVFLFNTFLQIVAESIYWLKCWQCQAFFKTFFKYARERCARGRRRVVVIKPN